MSHLAPVEHDVVDRAGGQVVAHRQPCLPGTDHHDGRVHVAAFRERFRQRFRQP